MAQIGADMERTCLAWQCALALDDDALLEGGKQKKASQNNLTIDSEIAHDSLFRLRMLMCLNVFKAFGILPHTAPSWTLS